MKHRHALHCLHFHGWDLALWCHECRRHWEETCGQLRCPSYEQRADMELAHQVCLEMEDGKIPIPVEYTHLDLSETKQWPPVIATPSPN